MNADTAPLELATPAQLDAEADAVLSQLDPSISEEPATTQVQPAQLVDAAGEFRKALKFPVELLVSGVIPQWGVDEASKTELIESGADCLAQLFPDGLHGRYASWFRLITCSGFIVAGAAVKNGGKLPLGPKREPVEATEHGAATPAEA